MTNPPNSSSKEYREMMAAYKKERSDNLCEYRRRQDYQPPSQKKKKSRRGTYQNVNPALQEIIEFMSARGITLPWQDTRKKKTSSSPSEKQTTIMPDEIELHSHRIEDRVYPLEIPLNPETSPSSTHTKISSPFLLNLSAPTQPAKDYVSASIVPRMVFHGGDHGELVIIKFFLIRDKERVLIKFPGGKVEPGETITEAAERELIEEAPSLPLKKGQLEFFGEIALEQEKYVGLFTGDFDGDALDVTEMEVGWEQAEFFIWTTEEVNTNFNRLSRNQKASWQLYKKLFSNRLQRKTNNI